MLHRLALVFSKPFNSMNLFKFMIVVLSNSMQLLHEHTHTQVFASTKTW